VRLSIVITILAGLMFLAACSDPASDKTKAVTGEAAPVASSPATGQGQKDRKSPAVTTVRSAISRVKSITTARPNRVS
jgi:PBP1b-binding outer membrane lipoprotein LpoB